jgi:hypothetical protein
MEENLLNEVSPLVSDACFERHDACSPDERLWSHHLATHRLGKHGSASKGMFDYTEQSAVLTTATALANLLAEFLKSYRQTHSSTMEKLPTSACAAT